MASARVAPRVPEEEMSLIPVTRRIAESATSTPARASGQAQKGMRRAGVDGAISVSVPTLRLMPWLLPW